MSASTELAALKLEVAELKKQLAKQQRWIDDLKPFLSVQKPKGDKPNLHVQCSQIELRDANISGSFQAIFAAHEDGPFLWMNDRNDKLRLILKIEDDEPSIVLQSKEQKEAVLLNVNEPGGLGQVAVLAEGSPRAVMKAVADGHGAVSVVHEDGKVRACMCSSEHHGGEFLAVTPDMKTGIKITSDGPHGGAILVNHSNGKNGVAITCIEKVGVVVVSDRAGNPKSSLPDPKEI